jgi:LysM repeat protein
MQKDENPVHQAIQNAMQALQRGDQAAAHLWAERAASLAPHLEKPWLILGAASEPSESIIYLEKALAINPNSTVAQKGLAWARKQLMDASHREQQPVPPQHADVRPVNVQHANLQPRQPKRASQSHPRRTLWLALATISILVLATWFIWSGNVSPAFALFRGDITVQEDSYSAPVDIAKPTHTPPPTWTFTPSTTSLPASTSTIPPTQAPSNTPTFTSTLSPTDLPTSTLVPVESATPFFPDTLTPEPVFELPTTYTVQSEDTLYSISQQLGVDLDALAAVNGLGSGSTLYIGQVLTVPQPGQYIPPTSEPLYGQKRILVDISQQHLYAYEGDVLVFSFVASTGMNNATRVGIFSVLDKIPNAYGSTWNIWMPNWLGIYYSGYLENGIHALPILSNGNRLWEGYLGRPISYGCVVLGTAESQMLYDWVEIGTVVEIQP